MSGSNSKRPCCWTWAEEVGYLASPFAFHIPIHEIPERLAEIPDDRSAAAFYSSATRAVVAWVYLPLLGLEKVRILDVYCANLIVERNPDEIYRLTQ